MNATESTMVSAENQTVTVEGATAPVIHTPKPLTAEEKAKREATRLANEALIETVRTEAEALVMTQYGFPGVAMSEVLRAQSSTQAAIRKAAKDLLKPVAQAGAPTHGTPKIVKDTQRLREQLIKSLEFADRNNLLKPRGEQVCIFVEMLKEIYEADVPAGTFDSYVSQKPEAAAMTEATAEATTEA